MYLHSSVEFELFLVLSGRRSALYPVYVSYIFVSSFLMYLFVVYLSLSFKNSLLKENLNMHKERLFKYFNLI